MMMRETNEDKLEGAVRPVLNTSLDTASLLLSCCFHGTCSVTCISRHHQFLSLSLSLSLSAFYRVND